VRVLELERRGEGEDDPGDAEGEVEGERRARGREPGEGSEDSGGARRAARSATPRTRRRRYAAPAHRCLLPYRGRNRRRAFGKTNASNSSASQIARQRTRPSRTASGANDAIAERAEATTARECVDEDGREGR
jgi:hypothetical protein